MPPELGVGAWHYSSCRAAASHSSGSAPGAAAVQHAGQEQRWRGAASHTREPHVSQLLPQLQPPPCRPLPAAQTAPCTASPLPNTPPQIAPNSTNQHNIALEAEQPVLAALNYTVSNNTLFLQTTGNFSTARPIKITVTLPANGFQQLNHFGTGRAGPGAHAAPLVGAILFAMQLCAPVTLPFAPQFPVPLPPANPLPLH